MLTGHSYSFWVREGDPTKLAVILSGGGACWTGENCAIREALLPALCRPREKSAHEPACIPAREFSSDRRRVPRARPIDRRIALERPAWWIPLSPARSAARMRCLTEEPDLPVPERGTADAGRPGINQTFHNAPFWNGHDNHRQPAVDYPLPSGIIRAWERMTARWCCSRTGITPPPAHPRHGWFCRSIPRPEISPRSARRTATASSLCGDRRFSGSSTAQGKSGT